MIMFLLRHASISHLSTFYYHIFFIVSLLSLKAPTFTIKLLLLNHIQTPGIGYGVVIDIMRATSVTVSLSGPMPSFTY